eukprot:2727472-Amphidinium_carterae.2
MDITRNATPFASVQACTTFNFVSLCPSYSFCKCYWQLIALDCLCKCILRLFSLVTCPTTEQSPAYRSPSNSCGFVRILNMGAQAGCGLGHTGD